MLIEEDLGINGYKIYQREGLYKFTSDAILLSRFARVKKGDAVADFCAGSGIVGLHLYALNPGLIKSVDLFEMQRQLYELSLETIKKNGLAGAFCAHNIRVQDVGAEYNGKFSLIVCNPPYMPVNSGEVKENESFALARTETELPLAELLAAVSRALKYGGRVCLVHRAQRLTDLLCGMRAFNLEPKRLQFVRAAGKAPYLVLAEGVKGGRSGVKIEKDVPTGAQTE